MNDRLILTTFGVILGLALTGISYPLLKQFADQKPAGSEFETIDDFRKAMLKRDERDIAADRSVSLRSIITPHPSDLIMYDLVPNLDVKFQRVPVKTNSCGMRDLERSIEKPENVYRIALLGDSFAFGWGVELKDSFAQVTERILNDKIGSAGKVEVLNFGIPGYSTFQEVALFEERGLDFSPDAVLVYFVDNDFGLPFFIKDVHKSGRVMSGVTFARHSWKADRTPEVHSMKRKLENLLDANRSLLRLKKLADDEGIPVYVAINPNRSYHKMRKKLWALRGRYGLNRIEMLPRFDEIVAQKDIDPTTLSLPTDPHPAPPKHAILAEIIAEALLPEVEGALVLPTP